MTRTENKPKQESVQGKLHECCSTTGQPQSSRKQMSPGP